MATGATGATRGPSARSGTKRGIDVQPANIRDALDEYPMCLRMFEPSPIETPGPGGEMRADMFEYRAAATNGIRLVPTGLLDALDWCRAFILSVPDFYRGKDDDANLDAITEVLTYYGR